MRFWGKYTIHLWYRIVCFSSSVKVEYVLKSGVPNKEISILLPAFNEAAQIELCVRKVEEAVKSFSKSYEIIVSEDGSTDGTDVIVAKLAKINPNLVLLHSPSRLGKGCLLYTSPSPRDRQKSRMP